MASPPAEETRVISREDAGCRLDRVLAGWLGLSRSAVRALLESGRVALDGRPLGLVAVADTLKETSPARCASSSGWAWKW